MLHCNLQPIEHEPYHSSPHVDHIADVIQENFRSVGYKTVSGQVYSDYSDSNFLDFTMYEVQSRVGE